MSENLQQAIMIGYEWIMSRFGYRLPTELEELLKNNIGKVIG